MRRYIKKVYLGIVVMSIMCLVNNETALGNDMLLSHDLFFPVDSVYLFDARHVSSTTKPLCSINNYYLANDAIFSNILCKYTIFAPTTDILYPSISHQFHLSLYILNFTHDMAAKYTGILHFRRSIALRQ